MSDRDRQGQGAPQQPGAPITRRVSVTPAEHGQGRNELAQLVQRGADERIDALRAELEAAADRERVLAEVLDTLADAVAMRRMEPSEAFPILVRLIRGTQSDGDRAALDSIREGDEHQIFPQPSVSPRSEGGERG